MEGQVIAGYRIVRTIGSGGMGIVYEGVHQHLGRRVAIKLLHDRYSHDRDSLSRFYNEARAASLAQHPCVIDVYEFGFTEQGQAYIVMELLLGCSLEKRLREIGGRMGTPCLPIAQKLAEGLSFLHERGIVHRDLKPDNVMLVPDPDLPAGERVKLLDFGIAKLIGPQPKNLPISPLPTETGSILGTPAYLSPEQARGERAAVGPSADVYALGVILYEMLSGTLPFLRDSPMELVLMHAFADPQSLQKRAPQVPRPVASLVHKMLAKDPSERPSMQQVATELHRLSMRYLKADVPSGAEKHIPALSKSQLEQDLLIALLKRIVFREDIGTRRRLAHILLLPLLLLPGERPLAAQRQTVELVRSIPTVPALRLSWSWIPLLAEVGLDSSSSDQRSLQPSGMPQQTAGNQRAKKSQRGPAVTPLLDAGSESNAHAEKKPTAPGEKNVSDVIKAANKGIPFEEESESHHDKK
jgi:serine/threonine protein kinase